MARIPRTRDELLKQLDEQIGFLFTSCAGYDKGDVKEAKRLATSLRILFHTTKSSHGLTDQLGMKDWAFYDTAQDPKSGNHLSHNSLAFTHVADTAKYVAPLDTFGGKPEKFEVWWNKVVFIDDNGHEMSRRALILAVANQDGGAHVDPSLDHPYADLSRNNTLGYSWVDRDGNVTPMPDPVPPAIRQIAHETLKSLRPTLMRFKVDLGGALFGNISLTDTAPAHILAIHYQGPNGSKTPPDAPCPCGSGKPYKGCHDMSP